VLFSFSSYQVRRFFGAKFRQIPCLCSVGYLDSVFLQFLNDPSKPSVLHLASSLAILIYLTRLDFFYLNEVD
jgi:hypothetical protein